MIKAQVQYLVYKAKQFICIALILTLVNVWLV